MVFLDPNPTPLNYEPKRNSGFFSSQRPIQNPRDSHGNRFARRRPLEERSSSQINQRNPELAQSDAAKTTVRIVKQSPTVSATDDLELKKPAADKTEGKHAANEHVLSVLPSLSETAAPKPANLPNSGNYVSDASRSANEAQPSAPDSSNALLVSSTHAGANAPWQHRRSGSSGNFSTSSTLKEGDSTFWGGQGIRSRSRLSQGTTVRGTPTPFEQEHHERGEEEEVARSGLNEPLQASQTPAEASTKRSTVRVVPASLKSESSQQQLLPETIQSSPNVRSHPSASTDSEPRTSPATRTSRRTSSTNSLPTASDLRDVSVTHYPQPQRSQDSLAQTEASLPTASSPNLAVFASEQSILPSSIPPSSPNFVAYHSDVSRPRSHSHPLHGANSHESIASRLEYYSRPQTGTDESPELSSSTDTLPPLQLPKKRLRHRPQSLSLGSVSAMAFREGDSMLTEEETDTLPYPRYQYSSHLSTIASESDRNSRTSSQPLSHFSFGSGVLTGDDSSVAPLSINWSGRRRGSAPFEPIVSSSQAVGSSSEEEPGDMTLGVFREESAKPQPLFKRSGSLPGQDERKYVGPAPPIPPIPPGRESEENFDTVSELQSPALREQRSGYSLRARSNSTPSRSQSHPSNSHSRHLSQVSYIESDRGSHGSSIFPIWAKQFYKHNVPLVSASKISLGTDPRPGVSHTRTTSQWTERSITSRLGTGYSEIEKNSQASSHFLPSIFRPKTKDRSGTGGKKLKKGRGRPAHDDGRDDSMAITTNPLPSDHDGETTEAGQPKYGKLRDNSQQRRPLPRKYSKQRRWDEMEFPRPMTKDRLSDFGMHVGEPHLGPSKRISNRLSVWRAPSFVESLDTLLKSRTNRQILLFALGFVIPFCWMIAAVLPIPRKPLNQDELEKSLGGSEDDIAAAMRKHAAGDAEKRWREEKMFLKARWWRSLNRIMSVVGLLVLGAVVALAVVALT